MGYSARYHAASLAAVFLALAIGILIGSQVGGEVLDNTRKDLEASLNEDLNQARSDVEDLETELGWANQFGESVYPPLIEGQLVNQRIGLIGFGALPDGITESVDRAIQPTGAELVAVGVVRQPPALSDLAASLSETAFARIDRNPDLVTPYGRTTGRQMVNGGRIFGLSRSELMTESSGQFGRLDGLIIYRGDPEELEPEELELSEQLDGALIEGAQSTRARVVGVEEVGTEPSSVAYFDEKGVSTVDDLDLSAGRVSLVYVLAGAEGSFGVKEDSDRLLPELLQPLAPRRGADREQG